MKNGMAAPVILGLSVGIAMILVFSLYAGNSVPLPTNSPPRTSVVVIPKGASQQGQTIHLIPRMVDVVVGINNTVEWINQDDVAHTLTSDSAYVDKVSGAFDTTQQNDTVPGGYILPGKTFNFTFTEPGNYSYHGIPDPFMQGNVVVFAR